MTVPCEDGREQPSELFPPVVLLSCSSPKCARFIKNLSSRRKASSELGDEGAGNLFLIKVQWCLHYKGSVVFTLGDWGLLWKGGRTSSCCWWNPVEEHKKQLLLRNDLVYPGCCTTWQAIDWKHIFDPRCKLWAQGIAPTTVIVMVCN